MNSDQRDIDVVRSGRMYAYDSVNDENKLIILVLDRHDENYWNVFCLNSPYSMKGFFTKSTLIGYHLFYDLIADCDTDGQDHSYSYGCEKIQKEEEKG